MLTGDKMETAENIGRLCNLIKKNSMVLYITENNKTALEVTLKQHFQTAYNQEDPFSIVVEGHSLAILFQGSFLD